MSKRLWIAMVLLAAMLFGGCGSSQVVLKEFVSEDGTISIQADESWMVEDIGAESWLSVFNEEGSEGVIILQLPKVLYSGSIDDRDDVKELVDDSFGMSETKSMENPEVPGLSNVKSYSGTVAVEDVEGDGIAVYGETDYAFYGILYAAPKINTKKTEYFKNICATFKENAPEAGEMGDIPVTDTILWFNGTCAVLTKANGWDYTLFGGIMANSLGAEIVQSMLDEWWGVTDRQSADENMDWLLGEGHRVGFVEEMLYLGENGVADVPAGERTDFLLENFEVSEEEAQNYANWYNAFEEEGENVIAAWDYSRAMSLLGYYYLAGYYTEVEALDISYELASYIQDEFESWDSFMESYFIGYEYWAEEDSGERRSLYEEIKAAPDSPYDLDWNMTLEKSW